MVSAIKGIVPDDRLIVGEYFHRHYSVPMDRIGVVTGPCHAEEVALERLSYLTVASESESLCQLISSSMECDYIRMEQSDDIYGTEYAAVLKNVYAVAAGICHGLGYGDNFQAVLVSNAVRELKQLHQKCAPHQARHHRFGLPGRSAGDHLLSVQSEPFVRKYDRKGLYHTFGPNGNEYGR